MASGLLRKILLFLGSLNRRVHIIFLHRLFQKKDVRPNRLSRLQREGMVAYNEDVVECILCIPDAMREEYTYAKCTC